MKKFPISIVIGLITLPGLFLSCGEDRSGEYYALIAPKTWIYDTMQVNYLFYEDLPAEDNINFFLKPQELLSAIASPRDKKGNVLFSHIDSVDVARSSENKPSFGIEGVTTRTSNGSYAIRILYTQPNSPATDPGIELKRGDWIIGIDNKRIASNDYATYIGEPTGAHSFIIGAYNGSDFDTLRTTDPLVPRTVETRNLLQATVVSSENKKAGYLLYNEFGENDGEELLTTLANWSNGEVNDIILDLRYNAGGYLETARTLASSVAPQEVIGQTFLNLIFNDKLNREETLLFGTSTAGSLPNIPYEHLYVITGENTASASESLINSLRPYLGERLIQVGSATFGKNVAQEKFTNPQYPEVELWLTTCYAANADGYYDYYDSGLLPDYEQEEDYSGELGELGSPEEPLLQTVLTHMNTGSFPAPDTDETTDSITKKARHFSQKVQIIYNSVAEKPHTTRR